MQKVKFALSLAQDEILADIARILKMTKADVMRAALSGNLELPVGFYGLWHEGPMRVRSVWLEEEDVATIQKKAARTGVTFSEMLRRTLARRNN